MGRLSVFAKNLILNLRFQKSLRIKQIASVLSQENKIQVSRKSISAFLKKYIETSSIDDKKRTGRNKKLSQEEIDLIGEITRLNRDITATKIKEYLNLNVSTYTILRASKLFEWNKINPNSNLAKKIAAETAALEREISHTLPKKNRRSSKTKKANNDEIKTLPMLSSIIDESQILKRNQEKATPNNYLSVMPENEIQILMNSSSSPMVFSTKILYKLFSKDEIVGHNVSGKTFSKNVSSKKPLDEERIKYIKEAVKKYFKTENFEELWKSCRTAINKSIRNFEIKNKKDQTSKQNSKNYLQESIGNFEQNQLNTSNEDGACNVIQLESNLSLYQMTNEIELAMKKM